MLGDRSITALEQCRAENVDLLIGWFRPNGYRLPKCAVPVWTSTKLVHQTSGFRSVRTAAPIGV